MTPALETLRGVYARRDQAARAWKAAGGQVVGYLGRAPEALIMAAGMLPYRLSGDPQAGDAELGRRLYPLFNKPQQVRGLIDREQPNTILEQLFAGRLDFLDRLVIVNDRKDISQIIAQLRGARRADPGLTLPPFRFLDRVPTPSYSGSEFNRARLLAFAAELEAWSGRPLREADLAAAIADWNAQRQLFQGLAELRRAGGVAGPDALAAIGAGWLMPKPDHARLLGELATGLAAPAGASGVRLALAGSPMDHDALHRQAEACGARIVFDGHEWGEAALDAPIAGDLPPFEAIVEQFNARAPFAFPLQPAAEALARTAVAAGADGAVIVTHRHDSLAAFDTPDLRRAFEAAGLPVLTLETSYAAPPAEVAAPLGAFVSGLAAKLSRKEA